MTCRVVSPLRAVAMQLNEDVFRSLALSPGFRGPTAESQLEFAIKVLDEDPERGGVAGC